MGGPSLHGGHIPSRLLVTGALAILGFAAPAAHAGTVTILSQFREIDASAGDVLVTRTAEPGNFGTFDAVAEADVSDENGIARARSTVNSRLGQDGFFFSGTTSYEKNFFDSSQGTGPKVGHHLGFRVEFSVDAPYRYEFVAVGRGTTTPSGVSEDSGAEFEFSGDTDALGDPGDTGIIQPGTYTVFWAQGVETIGLADTLVTSEGEYDFHLALTPVDTNGGGGGEPNPIPLPPAVWSGLAVLGAGALNRLRRRRAV